MEDDAQVPEVDRRLRGCLLAAAVIAVLCFLGPLLLYYLYQRSAIVSAERSTLRVTTVFAEKVVSEGSVSDLSVRRIDGSIAEVSVFSSERTATALVVSVSAFSTRGTLLGTSPFTRCHTVSFTMIDPARPRYSIEPLPGCAYEYD
ncbi:hypothetical protein [Streptosporangium sp. NPDC023615]|uniref:hypothetical protein n=1 Tax=Streptosporangium sp. NPDC023615 TaxID=3154794 RepID=UPI00342779C5